MSDLEITKLCAEAMGYEVSPVRSPIGGVLIDGHGESHFDPLYVDSQAMALMKRFDVQVNIIAETPNIKKRYQAWIRGQYDDGLSHEKPNGPASALSDDLNRAIVECVANMQRWRKS